MPIPGFQSFFIPILRAASNGAEFSLPTIRERLATDLQLTPADISEKLPSGTQTVFVNRAAWGSVYLKKAGALENVKRGVLRITPRGRELLRTNPDGLTVRDLSSFPEFRNFYKGAPKESRPETEAADQETPEEQLAGAFRVIQEGLANDVLEMVKKSSPRFFEELVVELLVAMGYGGSIEDAGQAVGRSGDGGIDGKIKEDRLGLDFVYIQAKRWNNPVGRPVVQAFAGSLEGVRARKGVLLTTSYFSSDALEYIERIEKRIVLVDGKQLADLMIEYNLGVTAVQTYQVKRIDSDYFEEND